MSEYAQRLGAKIKGIREYMGLTQAAVAERVGIDRTKMVRIESGERTVTFEVMEAIAEVLDTPLEEFLV